MFLEDQPYVANQQLWEGPCYHPAEISHAIRSKAPSAELLTRLERTVVAMSLRDGQSSIRSRGALARAIFRVFGLRPANRLANERLEVLRRYCVLLRVSRRRVSHEAIILMRDAGFSIEAMSQIKHMISGSRLEQQHFRLSAVLQSGLRAVFSITPFVIRTEPNAPS